MLKISAVIITLNEEKNIGRCLDSLMSVADEIVVVDSFSVDKTRQICAQRQVRFLENKFLGHIEQKNFAVAAASNNWVLSLDADEALDEVLQKEILLIKQQPSAQAYSMNRLTNYCGYWVRHCGWYPDKKLRLWDRRIGAWGGINPHDEVIVQAQTTTKHLKGDLLHYSYYNIHDHIKQVNFFTDIMAKEAIQKGKSSGLFKILFSPLTKFLKSYLFQCGFLDGYYGLVICIISAHATFIKYVKIRESLKE